MQSEDRILGDVCYFNGAITSVDSARVSIFDRGFLFSDGIYEVCAVLNSNLIDNELHLSRFQRSAAEISLKMPVTLAEIAQIQKELIHRNRLQQGVVYLQVTRGVASREFAFPTNSRPTLIMFTQAKDIIGASIAKHGIAIKTVPDIRWKRRDIKSIALLAQVLAKQEAFDAGCQEAWLVEEGYITEGASSTAFMITPNQVIVTRPTSTAILPGVTRTALLALSQETCFRIEERAFTVDEAQAASEAFITSASNFVLPVVKVDGSEIADGKPGRITKRLRQLYIGFAQSVSVVR